MQHPIIIQGGMGVAVSDWRLAQAAARLGQLGVVSGTMLAVILARPLQAGDPGGARRTALAQFPLPGSAPRLLPSPPCPVLTAPGFFDGSLDHLIAVRSAVAIPLLRKDFMVDEYQLLEARAGGADAILLIVAALADAELKRLADSARALGLAALVEVHDLDECDRALSAGATIIGVNNRNLRTLQVDLEASHVVAARIPTAVIGVSESGLKTPADLGRLAALGYRAFLIGERFMTDVDPGQALARLLSGA